MSQNLTPAEVTARLKSAARELGFPLVGATQAVTPAGFHRLHEWLAAGFAGEMGYLVNRLPAYGDLNLVLPGAQSLLLLAMPYRTAEPQPISPGQGRVSRYAWGDDYHHVIWKRLDQLCDLLRDWVPDCQCRGVTDSAPLMEREFAQLAGLGWVGKNTLLLNREYGSWFFLAALVTDAALEYDHARETDHCGTCTACLAACPTDAFPAPYILDATKCISYLTIETKGSLSDADRARIGDWFWGCDICQDVCPWNHKAPPSDDAAWQPREGRNPLELAELFSWPEERFYAEFRRTPLWRAKRRGLLRNAAIVLANQSDKNALDALQLGTTDPDEIIRETCLWAIQKIQEK